MSPLLLNGLLLILGLGVLYFGAEWLVRGAARIGASLGMSPIVCGLTVVSLGTSAPELAVCLMAALQGNPDIAMGNVMGSNLANLGLILGLTAVIRPLNVAARVVTREVPIMLFATALLYPLIFDGNLGRADGLILLVTLALYLTFVFRTVGEEDAAIMGEFERFAEASGQTAQSLEIKDVGLVVAGTLGLVLGGTAIVESAVFVATELGVSELLISLTVIAIGTSLPELATSMVAAMRRESDIAVGNIIGSNIFNVAAILGTTSVVARVDVSREILTAYLPAVLVISFLAVPLVRAKYQIRRWEGAILLTTYVILMTWLFRVGVVA